MSKKLISILMACLMVMSFAVVASADNNVTLTVGTVDAKDLGTSSNIDIPIIIDNFPSNDVATIELEMLLEGYESVQVKSLGKIQKGDIVVGLCNLSEQGYSEADIADYATGCSVPSTWGLNNTLANAGSAFKATYAATTGEDYYSNDLKNAVAGSSIMFKIRVNKTAVAKGLATLKILSVEFGDSNGKAIACNTTFVDGGVICTEEVITPSIPEKSTVTTFPKRMWNETTGELTTVGVITVGQDYDGLTYGIKIDKAGTYVTYPTNKAAVLTTDSASAYYAVGLNGITADTDIKATSGSYAYLSNGEQGKAVTENAAPVTAAE